jgi:hypothetical protein
MHCTVLIPADTGYLNLFMIETLNPGDLYAWQCNIFFGMEGEEIIWTAVQVSTTQQAFNPPTKMK